MKNELLENWSEVKTALLTGLPERKKAIVGQVLENQKQHMLSETAAEGSVGTDSIAGFRKIMLPMIRRVIPSTIATELVGVQPMTGPVGLIYSLRYTYNDDMPAPTSLRDTDPTYANPTAGIAKGSEAFGNVNALRRFYSGETSTGPQVAGTNSFGGTPIAGTPTGTGWGSALDAAAVGAYGAAGPLHGGGGSYLEGSGGRRMGLQVVSQAIEAKTRKLQAGWTIEAMQDLQNQHGLDLENELTTAMSAEIVQEIDNEIITDLIALAGTVGSFDGSLPAAAGYYRPTFVGDRLANLGVQINYIANEIARKTRKGAGNWIVVSPMIVSVLQTAAKSVFAPAVEGSFKGPNNTMLVGTLNGSIKVYSYLWNQSVVAGYNSGTGLPGDGYANAGDDTILIGYKGGNGETDTGYFYCPYIPLMSTGTIFNPNTFQPTLGLMTRVGKAQLVNTAQSLGNSSDYYGKITVNNLSLV